VTIGKKFIPYGQEMRLSVLGSGSAGNCIVMGSEKDGYWLIDAGLSAKQICTRLESVGVEIDEIKGVFITHEHKDHVGGLRVFLKKHSVPVYVSELTQEYLVSQLKMEANWAIFEPGQKFLVEDLEVEAIRIPHDATDPVGFIFTKTGHKLGVFTDLGYASDSLINRLKGVEILYLESNYDVQLLEQDQKRPWSIKQRISSRHGHLSNEQALSVVTSLYDSGLHHVAFGHLSRDCNTPESIAKLMQAFPKGLRYEVSSQSSPTSWLEISLQEATQPDIPLEWTQETLF